MKEEVHAEWAAQKQFLKELAEINGIEFDPDKYVDQTIKRGLVKKGYLQSDAALYMGEQLDLLKQKGQRIYFPWRTDSVICNFNGARYSLKPWRYVPTVATPKIVGDKDLITAVSFNLARCPEQYLENTIGHRGLYMVCRSCLHTWCHRCGVQRNGELPVNPDDITEITLEDGTVRKAFKCPSCGSLDVFRDGPDSYWD